MTRQKRRSQQRPAWVAERARELLLREPQYLYDPIFDSPDAERVILSTPESSPAESTNRAPSESVDFYTASLYRTPLLSPALESHLFRKMNYLKFRAHRLRQRLDPETATAQQVREIERLEGESLQVRNRIVEANLRLTVALAKKFSRGSSAQFEELLSEGHEALIRAVNHFDFSRGTKLSTYATWVIRNSFLAHFEREQRQARRRAQDHEAFVPDDLTDTSAPVPSERATRELRRSLAKILHQLSTRERTIIEARFGLNGFNDTHTLPELGRRFGVSKERVRQLQIIAIEKLRLFAKDERLEPPDDH